MRCLHFTTAEKEVYFYSVSFNTILYGEKVMSEKMFKFTCITPNMNSGRINFHMDDCSEMIMAVKGTNPTRYVSINKQLTDEHDYPEILGFIDPPEDIVVPPPLLEITLDFSLLTTEEHWVCDNVEDAFENITLARKELVYCTKDGGGSDICLTTQTLKYVDRNYIRDFQRTTDNQFFYEWNKSESHFDYPPNLSLIMDVPNYPHQLCEYVKSVDYNLPPTCLIKMPCDVVNSLGGKLFIIFNKDGAHELLINSWGGPFCPDRGGLLTELPNKHYDYVGSSKKGGEGDDYVIVDKGSKVVIDINKPMINCQHVEQHTFEGVHVERKIEE